jgi:glycosyltransferase involved in cell wall biosynthesis
MRLLILTQIIDTEDSMLGFMHTWVEEFSKHFEKITVVCLKEGKHSLPKNVRVLSLGKEQGVSKTTQLFCFYKYILNYRKEYDAVYVHMNQEYVLLGGLLWRVLGKYVTMWRNHHMGSLITDVASFFCQKVFCTSKFSYTAKYAKTVFMPVGVPAAMFRPVPDVKRVPHSILSFVRISPAKKIEQLITVLDSINKKGIPFTATICGDAIPEHKAYESSLHDQVAKLGLSKHISFMHGIPYEQAPALYTKHDISVNQSPSGMFDKTIFEAMLCHTLALSCNENLRGEIDELFLFREDDKSDLADKLEKLLLLSSVERDEKAHELALYTRENHSLAYLGVRLKEELHLSR